MRFVPIFLMAALSVIAQAPPKSEEAEILEAARREPVEVEAFVYWRLRDSGRPIPAKVLAEAIRSLRERAASAAEWYPHMPSVPHIPDGYGGFFRSSQLNLNGFAIFLDALDADAALTQRVLRDELSRLPHTPTVDPKCNVPLYSTRTPLYGYLRKKAATLYSTRDQQTGLLADLAAGIDSAYEVALFAQLASAFPWREREDLSLAAGYLITALGRVPVLPTGASALNRSVTLSPSIERVVDYLKNSEQSPYGLINAYRDFTLRQLAAPICTADAALSSEESTARRQMVEAANGMAAAVPLPIPVVTVAEIADLESKRSQLNETVPTYAPPATVKQQLAVLLAYSRSPTIATEKPAEAAEAMAEFTRRWRLWDEGPDYRFSDNKILWMGNPCLSNVPVLCKVAVAELVAYLSGHKLKKWYPAIWVSSVNMVIDWVYRKDKDGVAIPPDPAMVALIDRAADPAIRLMARVSRPRSIDNDSVSVHEGDSPPK